MSKERELLNRCAVTLRVRNICPLLLKEVSELLAQPEEEPVDYTTNIIELPVSENMTVEQCLDHVKRKNLKQVLVVGIDENDKLVTSSSKMTFSEAVYFLELAKYGLLGARDE